MSETIRFPEVITFRVDSVTKERLDELAQAKGASIGVFCRAVILQKVGIKLDLPRHQRAIANREELRKLVGELGAHGSNLNQLARRLNAGGTIAPVERELMMMSEAYRAALASVTSALGVGGNV